MKELAENAAFSFWEKADEEHTVAFRDQLGDEAGKCRRADTPALTEIFRIEQAEPAAFFHGENMRTSGARRFLWGEYENKPEPSAFLHGRI